MSLPIVRMVASMHRHSLQHHKSDRVKLLHLTHQRRPPDWKVLTTWPCSVMTCAVGARLHTTIWSAFCGFTCTLLTDCSEPLATCGGLRGRVQGGLSPHSWVCIVPFRTVATCTVHDNALA